ncbi:unnamed protein product [Bursaphelenchus xylophilus]|uniref:tRNA (guanine(10)-N(2))-methyltransferase TRMT11 n=1 Tax=Bursaphelenchus xylophilus TaxID=6326 RepID=A0A1I7RKP8_BURXY|nr:unnamed protein product [Bursaphelenchus xylophilus]CAG9131174.1 unnamed protein product [Bursaphelenchus xylophilus]
MDVLLTFSQNHPEFRKAEWDSILKLTGSDLPSISDCSKEPLEEIEVDELQKLQVVLERSVLLKHAHEVLVRGSAHESVKLHLEESRSRLLARLDATKTWRIKYRSHNKKKDGQYIEALVQGYIDILALDHMDVNMMTPFYDFNLIEDFSAPVPRIYLALLIGDGQGRLKHEFSLKTRKYIGNSTMDPELSFIQANISHVKQGDLVLDSFCGTGGLILAAARFGAIVLGSEISYMIARAKGSSARMGEGELKDDQNVLANFVQQGLDHRFAGLILADASQHKLWRSTELFDAIVADPPYGVREKGRKLGKNGEKDGWLKNENTHVDRYPEKTKYRTTTLYLDLMDFAANYLVVEGHVSFWYPVLRESYGEDVIPKHPTLALVSNCEQILSKKGSRRLLCYRKLRKPVVNEMATVDRDPYEETSYRDAIFGPPQ